MGRILRHRAGRRMFVGVLALAGLALVACEPLKQPPEPPPAAELPQICIPNPTNTGDPRAPAAAAPTDPGCTPICLPGQDPQTDPNAKLADPGPAPAPACVPICPPSDPGTVQPFAQAAQRCIRIPIPCIPGIDIPDCVNFCPPGKEPQPPAANAALFDQRCTPLCVLIPPGSPGACEPVPPDRR
jgi:hypothetical protein